MQAILVYTFFVATVSLAATEILAGQAGERIPTASDQQVVWCWGLQRRSANVPFLRIITRGGKVVIETKDSMHSNFIVGTKDVVVSENHIEFSYWYKPLARWARCSLVTDSSGDTMTGSCEGELSVGNWGIVPSYLWRC